MQMADQPQHLIRISCLNGVVWDISTPNDLLSCVKVIKADGFLLIPNPEGGVAQVIPYHAIASFAEITGATQAIPLATVQSGGRA